MKTVTIYIVDEVTLGRLGEFIQSVTHCFFDSDKAKMKFDECCIRDETKRHDDRQYFVLVESHTVRLPDDYEITTADKLDYDLQNGNVESPDYGNVESPDYVQFNEEYLNISLEELKEI